MATASSASASLRAAFLGATTRATLDNTSSSFVRTLLLLLRSYILSIYSMYYIYYSTCMTQKRPEAAVDRQTLSCAVGL